MKLSVSCQLHQTCCRLCLQIISQRNGGDITTFTIGGLEAGNISGYDTLYRTDGQTIYLSNDGSVYEPPADSGLMDETMLIKEEQA